MLDPALIQGPSDLESGPVVTEAEGTLVVGGPNGFGFDLHWLREVGVATLAGDLGLPVTADAEARVRLELGGSFRRVVSLDEQRRLRLQVFKRTDRKFQFAARVSASAQLSTPLPKTIDELAAAILGVHEGQWLKELRGFASKLKDKLPGVAVETLEKFLSLRDAIDPKAAAALWKAAENPEELKKVAADGSVVASDALAALLAGGDARGALQQLKDYAVKRVAPAALGRGLGNFAGFLELDDWVRKQLCELFGRIASEADVSNVAAQSLRVLGLRDSIYKKAVDALEKKLTAEASWRYQSAAASVELLDCSFDFAEEGLRLYRQALAGDYTEILTSANEHVAVRRGTLAHALSEESRIELHLPFLGRKEWTSRLDAFARMEVESDEAGRLLVYSVEASNRVASQNSYQSTLALAGSLSVGRVHSSTSFTLSYGDRRTLKPARLRVLLAPVVAGYGFEESVVKWLERPPAPLGEGDIEVSLALTIPGALVAAWLDAPGERSPDYFRVYSRISVAVQRAMRRWLPYSYFDDPERYEDLGAAFPLLVYQMSRPFFGKPRNDFTYDIMSAESMEDVCRSAAPRMRRQLARVSRLLEGSGRKRTAEFYAPSQVARVLQSVTRSSRQLQSLLYADAIFVDALVNLGCRGSRLRQEMADDPKKAVKDLARFSGALVKTFHGKLRRLYGGQDFLPLGSLLLVEATCALSAAGGQDVPIQAVLRLSRGDSLKMTFVNNAYAGRAPRPAT